MQAADDAIQDTDKYCGALASQFNIRPWEIERLTIGQYLGLRDAVDQADRESRKQR